MNRDAVDGLVLLMGLATVLIGSMLIGAVLSPDPRARRRAARIEDLERELEELKSEDK
jgi:hypothetical protein